MKGFLADALRLGWALFYWNARKSLHRLRGAHGRAPCHNPSDSGQAGCTGCDAVVGWRVPARFRAVCPLLERRTDGAWVCSVAAREVRPFWGRAWAWYGGGALMMVLVGGLGVFATMRQIGYEVTLRQVFWPPAWQELRQVQAELFIKQAREHFADGEVREALTALGTAHEMDPDNYAVGIMLAQFNRAGHPAAADRLFSQLLAEHPERAVETSRAWYLNLLARGQMEAAAELAARRLEAEPEQAAAWTHALVFTSRRLKDTTVLEPGARIEGPVGRILQLERMLRQETDPARRRQWLRDAPLPDAFPYAWVHRAERFIAAGFPEDALQLLQAARDRGVLGGRDLLPLVLAARVRAGDAAGVARETAVLLERGGTAELRVLALHLVRHPDPGLLKRVLAGMERAVATENAEGQSLGLDLYCAAGVAKDRNAMDRVRGKWPVSLSLERQAGILPLEAFFIGNQRFESLRAILPFVDPISMELLYSLLDRYMQES